MLQKIDIRILLCVVQVPINIVEPMMCFAEYIKLIFCYKILNKENARENSLFKIY